MIFKVDFEKAFDSLRWDHLDSVMENLGFGSKWWFWIHGCISKARSSVLVNGSHTSKFEIFKGLRQGDLLSPFLFILAMEGLHALTCKAEELGLFNGATFGRDNINVSHLMYADDIIFIGECNVLGVCVSDMEVSNMANLVSCGVAKFPLKYLGVPVGCNMARCSNWKAIIQKFSSKLSLWKARILSVGGCPTLIRSILGSLPTYYMSLYMMPALVLQKLESIRNNFFIRADQGLLFKWVWRLLTHLLDLWARVVINIHGSNGGIFDDHDRCSCTSPWCSILNSVNNIKRKGIDLLSMCSYKLGNGAHTRECLVANQIYLFDWSSVLRRAPRGGAELLQFEALHAAIGDVALTDQRNSWKWSLNDSVGFLVVSVQHFVDDHTLKADIEATRWNKCIPSKSTFFFGDWRIINSHPKSICIENVLMSDRFYVPFAKMMLNYEGIRNEVEANYQAKDRVEKDSVKEVEAQLKQDANMQVNYI
ncbi:RNA-directed DNA polymerase, eukaryota, reverse transcriptase zinc-binding domain protein [Tanacetum coccineum]